MQESKIISSREANSVSKPSAEPNQEKQFDFDGPILAKKGHEKHFIAATDRFSKFTTACIFEKSKWS